MSSTGVWCTVTWADLGGGTSKVVVSGEVDAATAPLLEQALGEAAHAAVELLVVDTSAVTFMDAAGLRVLLATLDAAPGRRMRLRLDPISRPVLRVLEAAGVTDRFRSTGGAPDEE